MKSKKSIFISVITLLSAFASTAAFAENEFFCKGQKLETYYRSKEDSIAPIFNYATVINGQTEWSEAENEIIMEERQTENCAVETCFFRVRAMIDEDPNLRVTLRTVWNRQTQRYEGEIYQRLSEGSIVDHAVCVGHP